MVIKPRSQCERRSVTVNFPPICGNVTVWSVNWSVADRAVPFLGGHRVPALISRMRDEVPTSGVFFFFFLSGEVIFSRVSLLQVFLTGLVNADLCSAKE